MRVIKVELEMLLRRYVMLLCYVIVFLFLYYYIGTRKVTINLTKQEKEASK